MLNFHIDHNDIDLDSCSNLFVFQTNNPNLFTQKLLKSIENKNVIKFDLNTYKKFLLFSHLSKLSEFISLNKSNILYREIAQNLNTSEFINLDKFSDFINRINNQLGINLININDCEIKSFFDFLEINQDYYLDFGLTLKILNYIKCEFKQLVVINGMQDINLAELIKLSNYYDFLIITNDLRNVISYPNQLELCVLYNIKTNDYVLIKDKLLIYDYLEKNLNIPINDDVFNQYLNEHELNKINANIYYFLQKIC